MKTETAVGAVRWAAALILAAAAGCTTRFEDDAALLDAPRLVAVLIEPPEVAAGQRVTLRAVAAGPAGLEPAASARWSLCTAPVPPTENGSVSSACLGGLPPAGPDGESVTVTVPTDACARFGPDTPPGNFRPRDPDATGGFYQPVRVDWAGQVSFAFVRLSCGAGRVAADVALDFRARYAANHDPQPLELTAAAGRLSMRWPPDTAEPYVRVDPAAQRVVDDVESLSVSWFVTAGSVDSSRSEGGEGGAEVAWSGPPGAAVVAVVRDDRGGAAVLAATAVP